LKLNIALIAALAIGLAGCNQETSADTVSANMAIGPGDEYPRGPANQEVKPGYYRDLATVMKTCKGMAPVIRSAMSDNKLTNGEAAKLYTYSKLINDQQVRWDQRKDYWDARKAIDASTVVPARPSHNCTVFIQEGSWGHVAFKTSRYGY